MVDREVGNTIRIWRLIHRMTQLDLSQASGLTVARIWKIENLACHTKPDESQKLCEALSRKEQVNP